MLYQGTYCNFLNQEKQRVATYDVKKKKKDFLKISQRIWFQVYELQKSKKSRAFGKMEISRVEKCVRSFLQQEI